MKTKIINFKIEEDIKDQFNDCCSGLHTNPSHELRLFVYKFIKQNEGKQTLIPFQEK